MRLGGAVDDDMANLVVAQLLYLDTASPADISMYVNSPGGSVTAGMAVFDTMRYVKADVSTVCVGLAASMGAFLLASGHQGKRYALPNARVMIHQPLGGAQGQAADIEIQANEILHHKLTLNGYLAEFSGQSLERVTADTDRDFFMSAEEAVEYGLIDAVVTRPGVPLDEPLDAWRLNTLANADINEAAEAIEMGQASHVITLDAVKRGKGIGGKLIENVLIPKSAYDKIERYRDELGEAALKAGATQDAADRAGDLGSIVYQYTGSRRAAKAAAEAAVPLLADDPRSGKADQAAIAAANAEVARSGGRRIDPKLVLAPKGTYERRKALMKAEQQAKLAEAAARAEEARAKEEAEEKASEE